MQVTDQEMENMRKQSERARTELVASSSQQRVEQCVVRHRYLDEIERDMGTHKMECCRAFHRDCPEFIKLGREYKAAGGTITSWNPDANTP